MISYVANYELKKKLGNVIDLYVAQLGYEVEAGRLIAADAIKSIIIAKSKLLIEEFMIIFIKDFCWG